VPTEQQGTHILAIAPGGGKVWTANVGSGPVTELDVATRRALQIPGVPGGALASADSRLAYVPVMETGRSPSLAVVRRFPVGASPDGLALARR
jgi:DNA-binding beta-propeller fold protein YncE